MPEGEAEAVAAWLLETFSDGLEEASSEGSIELAVYTDEVGEAAVRAAFPHARAELVESGWEDRWKEFHRPVEAGGLWIGPPWIEPPVDAACVIVDPGRAFGTGAHPTTRSCLELLATLERGSFLDAGCGSGVLAVAAARLGFAPVRAVDLDEIAVDVAAETARRNGVSIDVRRADVLHHVLPPSDIVVANIELGIVERLLTRVAGRIVVTSGYLASETPATDGPRHLQRLELEGWAADVWAVPH